MKFFGPLNVTIIINENNNWPRLPMEAQASSSFALPIKIHKNKALTCAQSIIGCNRANGTLDHSSSDSCRRWSTPSPSERRRGQAVARLSSAFRIADPSQFSNKYESVSKACHPVTYNALRNFSTSYAIKFRNL